MLGSAMGKQCPTGRIPLTWLFRVADAITEDRAAIDSTMSYGNPVPVPHVSLTATGAGLRMRTVFQRIRVV
jgi:hypothetical protein